MEFGYARRMNRLLRVRRCTRGHIVSCAACVGMMVATAGCGAISIQPSCPKQLDVGAMGALLANQRMPGAIATYQWTVDPATAGTIADPTQPDTMFTAASNGTARFVLTASDGLFQVISSCETEIGNAGVAVNLAASSTSVTVGELVTLTCTSTGASSATSFVIDQVQGTTIELTAGDPGVVTLTPSVEGVPRFRCVGQSDSGEQSAAAFVNVTVTAASTGGGGSGGGGVVRR